MKKNLKLITFTLITTLLLTACGQAEPSNTNTETVGNAQDFPAVGVVEFGKDTEAFVIEKTGSVVAQKRANVFSEATGYISNINVNIGDYVQEGQILAQVADSTSTRLLEINKEFSQRDHSLAQQILASVQAGAVQDVAVMSKTVDNAYLNYQTQANNYSSNVTNLNQQISNAHLALVQAQEAYQNLGQTYDQSFNNYDVNQDNSYESLFKQSQNALTHLQVALETADLAYGERNAKYSAIRGSLKTQIDYSTYIRADQLYLNTFKKLDSVRKLADRASRDRSNDAYLDVADAVLDMIDDTESVLLSGDEFLKKLNVSPSLGLDAQINQFFTKFGQDLASIQQDRIGMKQTLNGVDSSIGANEVQITNLEGQLTQARLRVQTAQNALEQAKNTAQIQMTTLRSQIENSKNLYESSLAQLQGLKAKSQTQTLQSATSVSGVARQVATANAQLDNTKIKSPISGVVTVLNIKEGNAITTGQSVISIEAPEETIVETTATENELTSIAEGSKVKIVNSNGEESDGYVSSINTFSGTNSLFKVQVSVLNNNQLRNGTLVKLRFPNAQLTSGLFVPLGAIFFQRGQRSIYVVNVENIIEERVVKTGKIIDGSVEIESGLEIGDRVAITGAKDLKAGDKVNSSFTNYLPIPGQFDSAK